MDFTIEKERLLKLRSLISKTPRNKMRLHLVSDYVKLANFLIDMDELEEGYVEEQLGDNYVNYNRVNMEGYYQNLDSYFDNLDLIKTLTARTNDLFNKYQLYFGTDNEYSVNFKEMLGLLKEFFGSFDNKVYSIFKRMLDEGRIFFKENLDCEGCSYNISFSDYPYVIINNKSSYSTFSALSHELGHCYEHVINRTNRPIYDFVPLIEVPAIFFQKLFNYFVINHDFEVGKAYNEDVSWKKMIYYMNITNDLINRAFDEGKIIRVETINSDLVLDEEFKATNDNKLNRKALELYEPNLDNYLYVLSDIVANYFIGIYRENPKEGLMELNRFIRELYYTTLRENLINYGLNDTYSEEELRTLKAYQKQIYHF